MKYAVIDIGSNSVRLMLDGTNSVNRKLLKSTQLAKGMTDGVICDERIADTALAVKEFCDFATANGYEVMIFATEAVRSAKNGSAVTKRILELTGKVVDVIDGSTEAKIGFMGASGKCGHKCILDVGGASSELAAGKDGELYYSKSLPFGAVRLKDRFNDNLIALTEFLHNGVREYQKLDCGEYIAISGTATSLAAMQQQMTAYDPRLIHGSFLSVEYLNEIINELKDKSTQEITADYPILGSKRAEVILTGAVIMRSVAQFLEINGFRLSERDNAEGYLIYKEKITAP